MNEHQHQMSHKELILEYLLEGNDPEDMAEQLYDKLSQKERDQILDEIDQAKLEADLQQRESIGNDLIEAYKGYYEDEWMYEQGEYQVDPTIPDEWVIEKIMCHTPKQRLEVYLEWNGLIGYYSRIYELATGEL